MTAFESRGLNSATKSRFELRALLPGGPPHKTALKLGSGVVHIRVCADSETVGRCSKTENGFKRLL